MPDKTIRACRHLAKPESPNRGLDTLRRNLFCGYQKVDFHYVIRKAQTLRRPRMLLSGTQGILHLLKKTLRLDAR